MKKTRSLIIGSGVIGAYLSKLLLKKKHEIVVTSRSKKKIFKNYKKLNISKKVFFKKLNVLKKKEITKLLQNIRPDNIFYMAGQSSIPKSYILKKDTINSNFIGAKNFLEILHQKKYKTKFFKANSGYIFKPKNGKINLNCKLIKPSNPYVYAQQKTYKFIKQFRQKKINCYNLLFMQIESPLRENSFLIKKVCLHAKKKKKVVVGNINTVRDYSWIEDIVNGIYYISFLKPCDLILSSGKKLSGKQILDFAYSFKKLNYTDYYSADKKFFRKNETKIVIGSNSFTKQKLKKFNWFPKIHGKKLVKKIYDSL